METTPIALTLFERLNRWIQESIMVKLFSIGFLIIILLIPSSWIRDMIIERQQRADQAMSEVTDKWSGSQTISGPVLVIPYRKQELIDHGKEGKEIREHTEKAFFLPEQLDIRGSINPQILHRGIFDAVVYESSLGVTSNFSQPKFKDLSIPDDMVLWNDAFIIFGISDLRGISDNPTIMVDNLPRHAEPSNNIGLTMKKNPDEGYSENTLETHLSGNRNSDKGIIVKLNWANADAFQENVSIKLKLKGSRRLDFVPVGKTTTVELHGPWGDPSFDGAFLPASREISESGFTATWKVLHFNRPFSQQWVNEDQQLSDADFGVALLIPVDQYQKSIRTSKYGVLIILLTFIALFLLEITQKLRIHPFQYILIGAALTIYYTLLLSFSEYVGYNAAYIIASLATVVLLSLYSITFLRNTKLAILFSSLLSIFYAFIFVIILQQDFSLLLGSIGLFIIVGLLMYSSRKVRWYKETTPIQS
ncbi:MAG: cell envelope integrity protein CreD [Cyclobacteriaceae bacterium]|nr:cell envelope integrity protein CreD [Cyclobacteriaceae bacterium]MDH5248811.1 cell envelope integrity protein CreD [Cyclobacteriaceae bacterium]